MSDEIQDFDLTMDGQSAHVTIEQIMGFDISGIEADKGGFPKVPEGTLEFRISGAEGAVKMINDADNPGAKVKRLVLSVTCDVIAPRHLKDQTIDANTVVGMKHTESFFIKDVRKDIGKFQYLCEKIGRPGRGALADVLNQLIGVEFVGVIVHTKNKNDASKSYSNLDLDGCSPLGGNTGNVVGFGGQPAVGMATNQMANQAAAQPAAGGFSLGR